jgi:hypothetical protein
VGRVLVLSGQTGIFSDICVKDCDKLSGKTISHVVLTFFFFGARRAYYPINQSKLGSSPG